VFSVFFIVLLHCNTLCYYSSSVYCTVHCSCIVVCLLVMYMLLPLLRFFRAFSSVVRQMPGYSWSCKGRLRPNFPNWLIFYGYICLIFFVMYVTFSVFCVLFVCKCVLYYCHRVSIQLQLKYIISYHIVSYMISSFIIYNIIYHFISYSYKWNLNLNVRAKIWMNTSVLPAHQRFKESFLTTENI
jgi:hypothetical protein